MSGEVPVQSLTNYANRLTNYENLNVKKTMTKSIYLPQALLTILSVGLLTSALAQPTPTTFNLPKSKYGLPVVNDAGIYKQLVATDPDNELVDMRTLIPDAQFDVTYATTNNLVKRKLYPTADVFMRKTAALALQKASQNLEKQGFGFIFFDGYRPYAVTEIFYEVIKDTTFVADPHKGSRHNRGMAIDLSLYDRKTGKRLSMPSDYDETTPRAFQSFMQSDSASLAHRAVLRSAMEGVGFAIFPWEWWHYDFKGWESCFTYDLWHDAIRKANKK
ncbi:M15 family metallopeptidase [Spirosoma pollinicola]|uniref:D-alanyl-D-alanine dipeptidase n=1 Tax=Spirosoma pollinicola TaxID=2057025 RepID=A0A2K8Z1L5_9BACT|nr:M15 family metallopeptidase [Spirosoma pollinicola]AUD03729.1 D-alanyl-D-alanine dipeptidase [Spirosoma pollinicola]